MSGGWPCGWPKRGRVFGDRQGGWPDRGRVFGDRPGGWPNRGRVFGDRPSGWPKRGRVFGGRPNRPTINTTTTLTTNSCQRYRLEFGVAGPVAGGVGAPALSASL